MPYWLRFFNREFSEIFPCMVKNITFCNIRLNPSELGLKWISQHSVELKILVNPPHQAGMPVTQNRQTDNTKYQLLWTLGLVQSHLVGTNLNSCKFQWVTKVKFFPPWCLKPTKSRQVETNGNGDFLFLFFVGMLFCTVNVFLQKICKMHKSANYTTIKFWSGYCLLLKNKDFLCFQPTLSSFFVNIQQYKDDTDLASSYFVDLKSQSFLQ